jgi:hypothetical protein
MVKDETAKSVSPAVNGWPYTSSIWLKRVYVNPFGNASDMGKAGEYQGFVHKSSFDQ